jgi:hypothetical protein
MDRTKATRGVLKSQLNILLILEVFVKGVTQSSRGACQNKDLKINQIKNISREYLKFIKSNRRNVLFRVGI